MSLFSMAEVPGAAERAMIGSGSGTEEVRTGPYLRLAPAGEDQKYAVVITERNKDRMVCTTNITWTLMICRCTLYMQANHFWDVAGARPRLC